MGTTKISEKKTQENKVTQSPEKLLTMKELRSQYEELFSDISQIIPFDKLRDIDPEKEVPGFLDWGQIRSDQFLELQKKMYALEITGGHNIDSGERYGVFFVNSSGLYYDPLSKQEDQNREPIWISSPIWPEAYLRDNIGENHKLLIKVFDGEKYHRLIIPRRLLGKWADLSEILLDLGQRLPNTPQLQKYLQTFLMEARPPKLMRCVDKSGWHGDQYVFASGEVIGGKGAAEEIFPVYETCYKGIGKSGTIKEWQDNVVQLCSGNSRLIFSLGVAFASMCLYLSDEESGGFNLKGRSSTGKTKCATVAASVFGSKEYIRTWRTTSNGLEGICALHNDSLLPLDELAQCDSSEAGQMAYMIYSGMSKQRSSRTGNPREVKTWRVMLLSTGEISLEEHMRDGKKNVRAGQQARIVDVPAEVPNGFGCFENLHGYKDGNNFAEEGLKNACRSFHGTAASGFIKKVIEHGVEKVRQELRFAIDDFVADYANDCDGQVQRVGRRFGLVYSSLLIAIKLGILGSKITEEQARMAITACFNDWLGERGTSGDMESYRLLEQIRGQLNENAESKFVERYATDDSRIRQTIWGYREGNIFYLYPHAFKEHVCKGHDSKLAIKLLKAKGILIPDKEGKNTTPLSIPAHFKKVDRFLVIDMEQM
jgi:putative DNA primase/helicase